LRSARRAGAISGCAAGRAATAENKSKIDRINRIYTISSKRKNPTTLVDVGGGFNLVNLVNPVHSFLIFGFDLVNFLNPVH
jgi:hypothetical protein